ncbi:hypothetical protein HGRIS_001060 [Hohenbuehelia grisea]|uniref:Uncharacterized protein n=1 Tax=Hohenbuehelia grisea TaxID=104357 RepID=A0ABR3JNW5_9AGAR
MDEPMDLDPTSLTCSPAAAAAHITRAVAPQNDSWHHTDKPRPTFEDATSYRNRLRVEGCPEGCKGFARQTKSVGAPSPGAACGTSVGVNTPALITVRLHDNRTAGQRAAVVPRAHPYHPPGSIERQPPPPSARASLPAMMRPQQPDILEMNGKPGSRLQPPPWQSP